MNPKVEGYTKSYGMLILHPNVLKNISMDYECILAIVS